MILHDLLLDLIAGKVRTPEEWIATLPGIRRPGGESGTDWRQK